MTITCPLNTINLIKIKAAGLKEHPVALVIAFSI
jgi:hypothetical protein